MFICELAMHLGIPVTDIATTDGLNCMMLLSQPPVDEPVDNETNSTRRRLQAVDENDTNETDNTTTDPDDIITTVSIVVLPVIDPRANPGVTTDDLLSLDSVTLLETLQDAVGDEYDLSGAPAPVSYPILAVGVVDDHGYTASSDTDSITIKGLLTNNTGVVCWILYQGEDDAQIADVATGTYHQQEVDHGCQEVDNTVDNEDTITIDGLSDATQYVLAYTVRSADHR